MTEVERTSAGLQTVIPGCERRTLPKSTPRVDDKGQGLLHFYKPPSLREELARRPSAPLLSKRGQKALSKSGLFGSWGAERRGRGNSRTARCTFQPSSMGRSEGVHPPPIGPDRESIVPHLKFFGSVLTDEVATLAEHTSGYRPPISDFNIRLAAGIRIPSQARPASSTPTPREWRRLFNDRGISPRFRLKRKAAGRAWVI